MAAVVKNPWHAVSVVAGGGACDAAQALRSLRYLPREAPRLPLAQCIRQNQCHCKYQHHGDRRDGPRRSEDAGASQSIKLPERERRRPGERRERRR